MANNQPTLSGVQYFILVATEKDATWHSFSFQDTNHKENCCVQPEPSDSKVISGWAPTCDSAHSWQLYSVAPLGDQSTGTMTWYPTQLHYPDTRPTSPCPIPIMLSNWLGSQIYTFLSHWLNLTRVRISRSPKTGDWRSTHSDILSGLEWPGVA